MGMAFLNFLIENGISLAVLIGLLVYLIMKLQHIEKLLSNHVTDTHKKIEHLEAETSKKIEHLEISTREKFKEMKIDFKEFKEEIKAGNKEVNIKLDKLLEKQA